MRYLLICLSYLYALNSFSQHDKIAFKKYGVEEGLPEEYASRILQDDQGFMWIATQNGLVKYDGYQMEVFRPGTEQPSLQFRSTTAGLLKGKDGKIWMSTFKTGLASYDPSTGLFDHFIDEGGDSGDVSFQSVFLLFEDLNHNIWFNNYDSNSDSVVLCLLNVQNREISTFPVKQSVGSVNEILLNYSIAESRKDSSIWIMNDQALQRYDESRRTFETIIPKGGMLPGLDKRDTLESLIMPGNSGLVLTGNSKRLYLLDPISEKIQSSYDLGDQVTDSYCFFEDPTGIYWATVGNSIVRIDLENKVMEKHVFGEGALDFDVAPINTDRIFPMAQNDTGIWFTVGTEDSASFITRTTATFLYYDLKSNQFEWYDSRFNEESNESIDGFFVNRLFLDRTGLMWIGTRPNMYKQAPDKRLMDLYEYKESQPLGLPGNTISNVLEDSKGRLWIATSNGIALFDDENKQFKSFYADEVVSNPERGVEFNTILETSKNTIWTSAENQVYIYNEEKESFEKIHTADNLVFVLEEDDFNNIWITVRQDGLYQLNTSGEVIQAFTMTDSAQHKLTSNMISRSLQDSKGRLWFGDRVDNDHGLFRFDASTNTFTEYSSKRDGSELLSNEIVFICEDLNETIWAGTDEGGLYRYDTLGDNFLLIPGTKDYSITSINVKQNEQHWFGSYSGFGLIRLDPLTNEFVTVGEKEGLLHNDVDININPLVEPIVIDTGNKMWLPNKRGLSVLDIDSMSFSSYSTESGFQQPSRGYRVLERSNGEIWIGGDHGLNRIVPDALFTKDTSIPDVWITSMTIMDSVYSNADGQLFPQSVSYTDDIALDYTQKDLSFNFVALHYHNPEKNQYSWKLEGYDQDWTEPSLTRTAAYTNLSPGTYTFRIKGSNADGIWNEEGDFIEIVIGNPPWLTAGAYAFYLFILGLGSIGVHRYQRDKTLRKERERTKDLQLAQAQEVEKAYQDLEVAHSSLKSTQSQLIHSEKMASLGELTAGIAHEIQNPLNFVNNFSEINKEMLAELRVAVASNDQEEVEAILKDLEDNEDKVTHHGKRAEQIVKSMLQHSRTGSGEKELTDINALCDEYLRLSYHGYRAKDKSFQSDFKLVLDPELPKVNVVPQDIGRVLLNLINNAFQAVSADVSAVDLSKAEAPESIEGAKASGDYKPLVSVITKLDNHQINISVKDNGPGIPDDIKDKIFQPFFTTKPTGEGTGLGLSMSYDIVTKGHGGELTMNSNEGEGSEFVIRLPLV